MKANDMKSLMGKALTACVVAGAVALAAPQKAEAQVSFGVRIGRPAYVAPPYHPRVYVAPAPAYGYGYYDPYAWRRHEAWVRDHRYYGWR